MIRRIILHLIVNAGALYAVVLLLKGNFLVNGGISAYIVIAITFGILNSVLKPLLKLVTLPFIFMTAGFFTFAINMFLVWFTQYIFDVIQFRGIGLAIQGGWVTYLYAGVLIAVANMLIHWLLKKD
ncbi:phage holin family protein [Candidatus Peregrinibacteria bacterium]|nr:phage holin family protein [Candidatus Peregrinibacteria bacterium]